MNKSALMVLVAGIMIGTPVLSVLITPSEQRTPASSRSNSSNHNDLIRGYAAVMEKVPGVTGTDVSVWSSIFTIETGIILPGEARKIGEETCKTLRGLDTTFHRDGWAVVIKGATGNALYKCFI